MKREIKFRAWDVEYMSNPFTLQDVQSRKIYFTRECPIMQFTGLKDNNGIDIYEGDIVKAAWMHHGEPGHPFLAFIVYNEHIGAFQIRYENAFNGFANDEIYFSYQVEVIGNIYSNPELLNQK